MDQEKPVNGEAAKKIHLWSVEDLGRSVLRDVEIAAVCGVTNKFAREDFTGEWHQSCTECLEKHASKNNNEVRFIGPSGWMQILELAFVEATNPKSAWSFTISADNVRSWTFPLGA